jgi:hypothetical protein
MRSFLVPSVLVSTALCFGFSLVASPQARPQPYYYGDRAYGEGAPSDFRSAQMLFAGARSDLDRAENNLPEYSGDRYQFDRVRGELSELQRQWDESAYEPRQVDNVIRALDRALANSDLRIRDRDRSVEAGELCEARCMSVSLTPAFLFG